MKKKFLTILLSALLTASALSPTAAAVVDNNSNRDNTPGTLTLTESADGKTVTISYELTDGTPVSYVVPNNAQYLSGPLAGTDDLGRSLYTQDDQIKLFENVDQLHDVGVLTDDHDVGMFYFLLHGEHGDAGKLNITDILAQGGEAAKSIYYEGWGNIHDIHYVAEPLYGYYYSSDEWVIRKHMELLTNAGVDFLYMDVTNGYTYIENVTKVMKVLHEMNEQGYDAPEVVFYTNTNAAQTVSTLRSNIYLPNLYPDTWYLMDGKPLIIVPVGTYVNNFFTVRFSQWPNAAKIDKNAWPWIDWNVQQDVYLNGNNEAEAINVSVAQHAGVNGEGSWFSESAIYGLETNRGRSWYATYDENGNYVGTRERTTEDSYKYGYNFQSQFATAIEKDVPIVLVTGWNEWVAQPQDPKIAADLGVGSTTDMNRVIFVDNCTLEFSRDVEMTKGYYFDNYYMQLAANIQALKGAVPDVVQDMRKTIDTAGDFTQWDDIIVTYTDVEGDNADRNNMGYGQEMLTDTSGRNDIVASKVTADNTNLYFYVRTADDITTPTTGNSFMELYVNVDRESTGWYGYDYLITDTVTSKTSATASRFTGNGRTTETAGEVDLRIDGNEMMVAVPLTMLGIENYKAIDIEFKWADSETTIDEMEDFYTEGDVAPLGRMNYVFMNYKGDVPAIDTPSDKNYIPGDIDMNGIVDISDALRLFQHSLMPDLYVITYPANIDYNGDGILDISDALRLFQYSLMPDLYPLPEDNSTSTTAEPVSTPVDLAYISSMICTSERDPKGEGKFGSYSAWVSTDYLETDGWYGIEYELAAHRSLQSIAFYDENKTYISGIGTASMLTTVTTTAGFTVVPEGAKYVRFINYRNTGNAVPTYTDQFVNAYATKKDYDLAYDKSDYRDLVIACLGDSLTEGDYGIITPGLINRGYKNYPYFLAKELGCQTINHGRCGANTETFYKDHYATGLADISDADVILLMLGTNKGLDGTYKTYYETLINEIQNDMKADAILVLITPPSATTDESKSNYGYMPNVESACKTVREIAEREGLIMIDAFTNSPIQPENEDIYQTNDGLHMVEVGYKAFAEYIAKEVVKLPGITK